MLVDNYFLTAFLLICAYFIGSFPTALVVINLFTVTDARIAGMKIAGAYDVKNIAGLLPSICVFFLDFVGKGLIPAMTIGYWMPDDNTTRFAFSLMLIVGHNWSIFLKLDGGRGIATSLGILLGMELWLETLILGVLFGLVGKNMIYKDSALWSLLGIITLPALMLVFGRSLDFILFGVFLGLALLLKRLLANESIIKMQRKNWRVILFRLVWDRDIKSK